MDDVSQVTILLFFLMGLALVVGKLFEKFKIPGLVGQIFVGILFVSILIAFPNWSLYTFGFNADDMNSSFAYQFFSVMGELGVMFLMFIIGLETKIGDLAKTGRPAVYIAVIGIIIPFAFGAVYGILAGYSTDQWLLISVALFAMSTAITVNVLKDIGAGETSIAKLITNASVIDDILCLTLLAIISGIVDPNVTNEKITINTLTIIAFVVAIFIIAWKIKPITDWVLRIFYIPNNVINTVGGKEILPKRYKHTRNTTGIAVTLGMAICIGMAILSKSVGLAGVVGAFLAGMVFAEFEDEFPCREHFIVLTDFMLPFFFIFVGLNIRYDQIANNWQVILPAAIILCVIAIVSKIISGYVGSRMGGLDKESSKFVGVCMIPRGEVGVLVASIGLGFGIFTQDTLYAEIIIMTIVTSIIAPILITRFYKKMKSKGDLPPGENSVATT